MAYIYLGDRFTDPDLKGKPCVAVRRPDGKCIRGKNGNMLVSFGGVKVIVLARLLRKTKFKSLSEINA
jgi:hypothetical protein